MGSRRVCGFVPFPGSGAYGHWSCEREPRHLGRHRFGNYTVGRVPRFWRVRSLVRAFGADRRLRQIGHGFSYRKSLFPTKYEPVS